MSRIALCSVMNMSAFQMKLLPELGFSPVIQNLGNSNWLSIKHPFPNYMFYTFKQNLLMNQLKYI